MNDDWNEPVYLGDEFCEAFQDFIQWRKEIKKPLTPVAFSRLRSKLLRFTEEECTIALGESIDMYWTGVFPKTQAERQALKPKRVREAEEEAVPYKERIKELDREIEDRKERGY